MNAHPTHDIEEPEGDPRGRPRSGRSARWFFGVHLGLAACAAAVVLFVFARMLFATEAPAVVKTLPDQVMMWGFITAAASTAIGALAAAYAVSHVGAAALAAIGERPEVAGRALIFVGLAEGIAIYGLIISIMILGRLG